MTEIFTQARNLVATLPASEKELEHKLKSASEWDQYDKPRVV
jgi:hypothetical protein